MVDPGFIFAKPLVALGRASGKNCFNTPDKSCLAGGTSKSLNMGGHDVKRCRYIALQVTNSRKYR